MAFPPTIPPLHFWKAQWSEWQNDPDAERLYGKWVFCAPSKGMRKEDHGVIGVDVIVSKAEIAAAQFDVKASKKQHAYRQGLDFMVKDIA